MINLQISPHGHIALHKAETPTRLPYFYMEEWPNQDYPVDNAPDPAFIGQFYSEADFRWGDTAEVGVSFLSYRVLSPERAGLPDNERDIQLGMLDELTQDIRRAVVGASTFTATFGMMVTWYQVTFDSSTCSGEDCVVSILQSPVSLGASNFIIQIPI